MTARAHPPVLIVDDDAEIRLALRTLLEPEGYVVYEAASTVEAFASLFDDPMPNHVVLLDYLLSNSGPTLLHAVEQNATLRRHCYVLLTASQVEHFSEQERRLIDDICTEIITKPFNTQELLNAVATAAQKVAPQEG